MRSERRFGVKSYKLGIFASQLGFNALEFILVLALLAVIGLLVIPNLNLFLGIDKKIAAANVEAMNMKTAAIAYQSNSKTHDFPSDSDVLWSENYISQPRAYYTFDAGTGRILDATTDTIDHIPTNPWTGIRWDNTSDSWVKQ